MLFNEPKLLKFGLRRRRTDQNREVSVLFNEPKLLKSMRSPQYSTAAVGSFSALQRAEIAEIAPAASPRRSPARRFSALQRAEIAEIIDARLM